MKDCEIIDFLDKIETMFPVNVWKIQNRYIWPYVKMELCSFLSVDEKAGSVSSVTKQERLAKQANRIRNAMFHASGIGSLHGEVCILHQNVSRNVALDDGKKFDRNLDPFTILLSTDTYKIISLEYKGVGSCFPTFGDSFIIDGYMDRAAIWARIKSRFSVNENDLPHYEEFLKELPEGVADRLQVQELCRKLYRLNYISKKIQSVLRNGARLAITENGYGEHAMALFMACNDLGIRCIEVQHGVGAGSGHRWYTAWRKMPENGKRYEMLPDVYWCWSEKDKRVIDSWSQGRHEAYFGGRPILSVLGEIGKLTSKSELPIKDHKKTILLSLQPEVEYKDWLVDVIRETHDEYNWLIRRHPCFDVRQEKLIGKINSLSNVYTQGMETILLETMLAGTDLHITNHSSVVTDALLFNIPSIIMGEGYKDLFQEEIKAGQVILCQDKESMIHQIHQLANREKRNLPFFSGMSEQSKEFLMKQMSITA